MKKIRVLCAFAFLLIGVSQTFAQNIVGTWKMTATSFSTNSEYKKAQDFVQMMNDQMSMEKGVSMTMTLAKNGKVNSTFTLPDGKKSIEKNGTYKFENGVFTTQGDKNILGFNNIKPVFSDDLVTFMKEESGMKITTILKKEK